MHFKTQRKDLFFTVDEDTFYLLPVIPAADMLDLSKLRDAMTSATDAGESLSDVLLNSLEKLMREESFKLFATRFRGKDAKGKRVENPIDIETATDVIEWVVGEAAGKEPTPNPSS